jgi:hypothetical protein
MPQTLPAIDVTGRMKCDGPHVLQNFFADRIFGIADRRARTSFLWNSFHIAMGYILSLLKCRWPISLSGDLLHGVLDAVGLEFSIVFSCYMDTT